MSRLFACLSALLVSALVLAACPAPSPAPQAAPTATQQAPAAQATEAPAAQQGTATQLTLAKNDEYGEYLADGAGRALYLFAADEGAQGSTCNDQCAKVWPPLTVAQAKDVTAGDGVDQSLIGAVQRQDGTQQVTYHGHPVYYYTIDEGKTEPQGEGVDSFGAEWYLVTSEGEELEKAASDQQKSGTETPAAAQTTQEGAAKLAVAKNDEYGEYLADAQGRRALSLHGR